MKMNVKSEKIETAVILAAGLGSRLGAQEGLPKPLAKVGGVSLAERVLLLFFAGLGIKRFVIPVGNSADTVIEHFTGIGRHYGLTIDCVHATDWHLGNGASALSVKDHVGPGPFFLSMTDHLLDPEIIKTLAENGPGPGEMCLAVDYDKDGIFDLDDVTRVRIKGDRIEAINKNLDLWDAADTGVMLCTSGLFEGLEKAAEKGLHGLSDGLREMTGQAKARTVDVSGKFWLDVDTPDALREAESRLQAMEQEPTLANALSPEKVKGFPSDSGQGERSLTEEGP